MTITDGPWYASIAGAIGHTITNPQGRIIAAGVPSRDDAAFICAARAAHWDGGSLRVDWGEFGRAVAAARKKRRVSQDVAAEMCGISRNYMSMIERGIADDPGYTIILTLCRWLDLDLPESIGWVAH